jgi:hypothetical protein
VLETLGVENILRDDAKKVQIKSYAPKYKIKYAKY